MILKDIIKYTNSDASIVKFEQDNIIKKKDPETFLNELLNFSLLKKIFIINNVNDKILSTMQRIRKKN